MWVIDVRGAVFVRSDGDLAAENLVFFRIFL